VLSFFLSTRRLLVLAACGALTVLGATPASAGQAQRASGLITMTSERGDYIGAGRSYSYDGSRHALGVGPSGGAWVMPIDHRGFRVELVPSGGKRLEPKTYLATGRPGADEGPWIRVSGEGRGCNRTYGRFTVLDVGYGPHGYLRRLHATFEQHCERRNAPALRGEVNLTAAPAPAPLKVGLTFDADRVVVDSSGLLTLKGSIRCSKRAHATVIVEVTQNRRQKKAWARPTDGMPCSRRATDWELDAQASDLATFTKGPIDVKAQVEASDDYYTAYTGEFVYARDAVSARPNARPADPGAAPIPERLKVSGRWTMTSEQGDYVGGGVGLRTIPAVAITLGRAANEVKVQSLDGEGWYIRVGGHNGARLQERQYGGVARFPASSEPVLDVGGDGKACGETYGSFTVHHVEYGVHDIVTALHMSFEQRCDRPDAPALRGEVDLVSELPPPPLRIAVSLDVARTTIRPSGVLAVGGSVKCTQRTQVHLGAEVTETGRTTNAVGHGGKALECSRMSSDWAIEATPTNDVQFTNGPVDVEVRADALDEVYSYYTGDHILAVDAVSGQADVIGGRPPAEGGLTGLVSREPTLSLAAGLALIFVAVAATAALTLAAARRRRPS
jgi:hypothetical protein